MSRQKPQQLAASQWRKLTALTLSTTRHISLCTSFLAARQPSKILKTTRKERAHEICAGRPLTPSEKSHNAKNRASKRQLVTKEETSFSWPSTRTTPFFSRDQNRLCCESHRMMVAAFYFSITSGYEKSHQTKQGDVLRSECHSLRMRWASPPCSTHFQRNA